MMRRRAALVATAIVVATGIIYWAFLVRQAGPDGVLAELGPNVVIVTGAIVVLAGLTAFGALGSAPERRAMALWAAVPGLLLLGVLAGFSIGGFLLAAAVPAVVAGLAALGETPVRRGVVLLAAAVATLGWIGFGALLLGLASAS